jgi:benzodiazapine receptor
VRDIYRQLATVLATLVALTVNALASILPINGQTTGEISDQFDVYFAPAGYVFSIWGMIYLGLIGYTVYQALPSQRMNPRLRQIGILYVLSCLANAVWLLLWHYELFAASLAAMVALLVALIGIYLGLGIGETKASAPERWLVRVPFSLYLGWISVATIANATSVLDHVGWDGWGLEPATWAVIMLVAAGAIGVLVSLSRGDITYVLVLVWAFVGIVVANSDTLLVATTAGLMAVLVALSLLVGVPRTRQRRQACTSSST